MRVGRNMVLAILMSAGFLIAGCDVSIWVAGWTPYVPEPESGLVFSLEWDDTGVDEPHLYLTYPSPLDGDTTDGESLEFPIDNAPDFTEPYTPVSAMGGGDMGFLPEDIASGPPLEGFDYRGAVHYQDWDSETWVAGEPAVEFLGTASDSETIIVRGFPFASSSTYVSTNGGGITGLPVGSYTWVGVMEAYAFAEYGRLAYGDGDGVEAVLNVFQDGDLLASYSLPSNTVVNGASIVRVNCFYDAGGFEIYQLVPDVRVLISDVQIRSVAPDARVDENGVVTIRRPATR